MGRRTASTSFLTPIKADGVTEVEDGTELGRGAYTLAALTTYYFPFGGADSLVASVQLQGDAPIVITSATVQNTNFPGPPQGPPPSAGGAGDVTDYDATVGVWVNKDQPSTSVEVDGIGWSATSSVLAVVGGNVGGAVWHVTNTGARRHRLEVVVGATGGEVRVATWGKE